MTIASSKMMRSGILSSMLLKNMKNFILIVCLFFLLSSCEHKKNDNVKLLNPSERIERLNDSSFLASVRSIYYYNNLIFLCDYDNNRIACIDTALKLVKTFGRRGRGPGEFQGVVSLEIINDTIFALDDGNRRINIFTIEGNYLGEINIPPVNYLTTGFAADNEGYFYISSPSDESFPITKFDRSGKVVKKFGAWISPELPHRQRMVINFRYLTIIKDSILASVSNSEPIIEFYSLEGRFISKIDLSENQYIQRRLQYANDEKKKSRANLESTYVLFEDVYFINNFIYLLCTGQNKENKPECYKIITFNYKDQTPDYEILTLNTNKGEGWFSTFCISPNNIFAYNGKRDELLKYGIRTNNEK